ncbi:Hypothetical predicted protein [Pelobates cultripes]|uniref:Uncharacterized protein n=1 Tax=Pelobates cultripes TaxID=61616 RepID=A0AAD1VQ50_PELCU|nr:Hypothetical predicted protein [Pelobates cultripes]
MLSVNMAEAARGPARWESSPGSRHHWGLGLSIAKFTQKISARCAIAIDQDWHCRSFGMVPSSSWHSL